MLLGTVPFMRGAMVCLGRDSRLSRKQEEAAKALKAGRKRSKWNSVAARARPASNEHVIQVSQLTCQLGFII